MRTRTNHARYLWGGMLIGFWIAGKVSDAFIMGRENTTGRQSGNSQPFLPWGISTVSVHF